MQHIVEFAFSSFQKWGHIDPNRSGIGLNITIRKKISLWASYRAPISIIMRASFALFFAMDKYLMSSVPIAMSVYDH